MTINASDLPKHIQAQLGVKPAHSRAGKTQDTGRGHPYKCQCGESFIGWSIAERHAKATGHSRIELVLERRDFL